MKGPCLLLPSSSSSLIGPWRCHSILAPPREGGLCANSLEEQEEAGLEQGEGEPGGGLTLLADRKGEDGDALAMALRTNPPPGFWPMCRRAGWLRKMEEGRHPPCPPVPPISTLLPPSRLERGSWPPLAARAERERDREKETERQRETGREREAEIERGRERETEREAEIERER